MTKRRASIRGRGAEILFGEPADVDIEPRGPGEMEELGDFQPEAEEPPHEADERDATSTHPSDPPPRAATTSEVETRHGWEEEEIEEALRAEALDGLPRVFARGEATMLDIAPPLTAEMEVAFIEEAYAAQPPPEPVVDVPTPTVEKTGEEGMLEEDVAMYEPPPSYPDVEVPVPTVEESVEEGMLEEDVALYEPPPPEVGSVTSGVVPPRPERRYFEMEPETMLARDIQAPGRPVDVIVLPERELTDEKRAEIVERLGEGWIEELQSEIDAAYESVRRLVGENEAVAVDAYNTLLKARDILVMRKIDQLAQAEYYIELVRARMKRVSASESAAKKYQWRLLAWGLAWGIAFLVVLILLGQDWFRDIVAPASTADAPIELDIFVSAMLWGGVGGAVAVLYSLFKHVGERDFDSQFLVSYVGKPFLGLISGAIIYMAFNLVIRALGIFPAGLQTEGGDVVPAVAPGVVYLVAWAAGFKESRLLSLIDSLWNQIFGGKEEEAEEDGDVLAPAR